MCCKDYLCEVAPHVRESVVHKSHIRTQRMLSVRCHFVEVGVGCTDYFCEVAPHVKKISGVHKTHSDAENGECADILEVGHTCWGIGVGYAKHTFEWFLWRLTSRCVLGELVSHERIRSAHLLGVCDNDCFCGGCTTHLMEVDIEVCTLGVTPSPVTGLMIFSSLVWWTSLCMCVCVCLCVTYPFDCHNYIMTPTIIMLMFLHYI